MDGKYKELLDLHRAKFSTVVDVDRLLPILENVETLTHSDVDEINKLTVNKEKVDKLLDVLMDKDNVAFKSLCYALESTYPHLLTVMFLGPGNGQRVATTGQDVRSLVSLASDSEDDGLRRSRSSGDARSQDLKTSYTRKIPSHEYDDFQDLGSLEGALAEQHHSGAKHKHVSSRYSKHALNGESRHSGHHRDYDWLKAQCERAMSELQALKLQQTDNTKRYEAVMKESDSYRQSYMSTLAQLQKTREEVELIRGQNHDLIADNKRMEQEVKNLKTLREEDHSEMCELRKHQRDIVSKTASTEVLNALDMYDRIKQDYDSLRERYSDLVTQHSALDTKFKNSQDENVLLSEKYQLACSERDSAIVEKNGLKQQCTAAIRNWDQVLHERNDMNEEIQTITQQREDVMKNLNQALASQLRAKKELESVQKDRDAALREYSLVMSERDQVHKEIEQLQEKLTQSSTRVDTLVKEKKTAQDEAETLKREITSALQDRDKAVKERNELNDKCTDLVNKHSAIEKQREDYKKEIEMSLQQRDIARKERQEAMQDRDRILREKYEREQFQKEKADKIDQVNRETEQLKKQVEKYQQELLEGMHEAEIAKNRRDWAMSERDKIVLERDSVRTLCDSMRRDRDRAVSDLAQALRDYDEMKKQKIEAVRELKEIRDKYDLVNEKESRKSQLNSVAHNHSRDSAIDADLQEFETETIDIELSNLNKDDVGFELVGGKDDPQYPNDNSIFVSHIIKGSPADGKLRLNDQILRVNNKDTSNVEKRAVYSLLRNRSGIVNMQVLRRKKISVSRVWQPIQLSIPPGFDMGLHVENGLFVTHVTPGTYLAKEGLIHVGDRIVSVNGGSVENMSAEDLNNVLYQCGADTITLDIWRQTTPLSSAASSPVPLTASIQEQIMCNPSMNPSVTSVPSKHMESSKHWEGSENSGSKARWLGAGDSNSKRWEAGNEACKRWASSDNNKRWEVVSDHSKRWESTENNKRWDSTSESSKGSMKNIKSSGSQTDSLDSPSVTRRRKDRKHSDKDLDHKTRHSVHIFDKALENVNKIFRTRNKSSERIEEKGQLSLSRPHTMIEDKDDIAEFVFSQHRRDNSGSSNTNRSSGRQKRDLDPEINGTGTWPKCLRISNNAMNGTVVQPQKNHHKRPTLDAVKSGYPIEPMTGLPTARVPPLPPERNVSSFVAARHTPQNSDSTITYSSHPPSPSLSPQPSNTSTASYFQKSPASSRHSFNFHEPQDSQNSLSSSSQSHHPNILPYTNHAPPSSAYHHKGSHQSHHTPRSKVNSRNPPPMPPIHTHLANQYQLEHKHTPHTSAGSRRPVSGGSGTSSSHDQRNSVHLSPSSHNASNQFGARWNNTTPEPASKPLPGFTDKPPGGKPYPTPSITHSSVSGSNLLTPSQPVIAKQHKLHQATTTVHIPPFSTNTNNYLPDSISEFDHLPPYPSATTSDVSCSSSPLSDHRFTPTPVDAYHHPSFPNTSPLGRNGPDHDLAFTRVYPEDRFRIRSTPSIQTTGTETSGSIEIVSERSISPCSPFPDFNINNMLPCTSTHADQYWKKPKPGEMRKISIEKTSKLVGFQIEMGPSGGIFVSSVNENSLAAQAGLVIGHQLLEICAINMRNATYDLAARVLQQCGNNLTLHVQYNPEKYNDNNSLSSEGSTNPSPQSSPDKSGLGNVARRDSRREPKSPARVPSQSSGGKYDAPRKVSFKKPNPSANLGIALTGGNAIGLFVQNIEENSPAAGQNIRTGDQVLEYNGIDFTRATAEQAYRHLCEPCSSVRFRVRYHPSLYNKVRNKKNGDSIYVRAMMDHAAEKDGELGFRKDDLLHIEDTMYNAQQGVWYAWIITDEGKKLKGGTVPSKDRLEDEMSLHRSLSESMSLHDSEEFKVNSRRGSGTVRRSFWRRNKKHQRNNSKDSREFNSFSDVSVNSDSLPVLDDSMSTYLSVERLEYKKTRPVVLIAPLAKALIKKLSAESPNKYNNCQPTVMQTTQSAMTEGLKDGHYIDFWQEAGDDSRFLCIRLKAVTDICDTNVHCLLNVNPSAIERLQRQQIYPIVIYARHKSFKSLREVKDGQFLPEKLSLKSSKELFEYCQKVEQDYRPLISATIQGGNLAEMVQQVKNVISAEQEKPIWVPSYMLR